MEPAGPHGREGENSNKTHRLGHQRSCGSRRDVSGSEPQLRGGGAFCGRGYRRL